MSKEIKWNEGDGSIVTSEGGVGDAAVAFSSIENVGIDREQDVTIATKEGVERKLTVKQIGLREVFMASDGDFILADGGTFNVLKS